jgi:hypothetical protein
LFSDPWYEPIDGETKNQPQAAEEAKVAIQESIGGNSCG